MWNADLRRLEYAAQGPGRNQPAASRFHIPHSTLLEGALRAASDFNDLAIRRDSAGNTLGLITGIWAGVGLIVRGRAAPGSLPDVQWACIGSAVPLPATVSLMEARGIEPRSEQDSDTAPTCVGDAYAV